MLHIVLKGPTLLLRVRKIVQPDNDLHVAEARRVQIIPAA